MSVFLLRKLLDPPDIPENCSQFPSLTAFDEVTTENVEKLLTDSAVKQCELDSMQVRLLKTFRYAFAPILAMLINISLISGILPDLHKRAIIRPRIKKPGLDLSDPANYRPISNLFFVSKLVELHRKISNHSESHNLLPPPTQSGFRKYHSTEAAVVKVYNDIVLALNAGFITALFLLDFSADFDCVDHSFSNSPTSIRHYIYSSTLKYFFPLNRSHKVRIGAKTSETYNILFGVPQGSILGPLLFILYTSNITSIANRFGITIHLYADDTQLYVKLSTMDVTS
jgi:hypothetical protein